MSSSRNHGWVIGIDEVGRGPLAGPVAVCALALPRRFPRIMPGLGPLRDSKKLTPRARRRWAAFLRRHPRIRYVVSRVSPAVIDHIGIARAANLAAWRAYTRLTTYNGRRTTYARTYLDGGLFLKNRETSRALRAVTSNKADERVPAVAAASIVAKVARDRAMARFAKRYPGYGFEIHSGYGTAGHRRALRRRGPSPIHRLTFLGRYARMAATWEEPRIIRKAKSAAAARTWR